ncbi:Na+/H+ antiporter subunit C [Rickettsiales bacterium]|nr:Na+/H+ antiporter subunit C [Rickettsiales bacterium]
MISEIFGIYNYYVTVLLMIIGMYIMISSSNLIKKLVGMTIFQTSVLLFYISLGFMENASPPILKAEKDIIYSNPIPHVLMLTAIVVGVATLSVGLAIAVRIKESFGAIDEVAIHHSAPNSSVT